jgi:hypothetical protein
MATTLPEPKPPAPGDAMADGTIYAGISPTDGKPMYALPKDASVLMTFNDAADYAAELTAQGHDDWHVPTREELRVLFNSAAAIGGFDMTGQGHATWYWSSTAMDDVDIGAICQRFSDGFQEGGYKTDPLSIRLVRTSEEKVTTLAEEKAAKAEAETQARSAEEIRERLREKAARFKLLPDKGDCSPWKPCR